MGFDPNDVTTVFPQWRWSDLEGSAATAYLAFGVVGNLLRRRCGWRSGIRAERLAITLVCGIFGSSLIYWTALVAGAGKSRDIGAGVYWFLAVILLASCEMISWSRRRRRRGVKPKDDFVRLYRRASPVACVGYLLIAVLVFYYLARTAPLFEYDGERLRLYGAAHSDKMTSVMPCAGLRYEAPSENLRFAGYPFLNHYFPHLAAAALNNSVGLKYLDGYWFHLPVLGIVVNGLAILAFSRRVLKSYAAGCVGVALYGLLQVTAYLKPLDMTPALALLALSACDRFHFSRRKRWAVAGVAFVGAMACYEVFHAALLVAALGLWGAASAGIDLRLRRRVRWERLVLPTAAAVAVFAALQMMNLGHRSARPEIRINNTFGDSYRHEWLDRAKGDDAIGRTMATLYAWNRNKVPPNDAAGERARPAWYQRVAGRATFGVGLVVYVYARFGLWATFGWLHVWRRRLRGLRPSEGIVLAATCVGFGAPWFVDVGIHGGGQWWSSPNLYRVTEFAAWMAATLGTAALMQTFVAWRRPRSWVLAGIAAFAAWTSLHEHEPAQTYFDLDRGRLEAIAYLRNVGSAHKDEIVIHPWSDCSIRRASDGAEAYLQKRFFMLVSELAGRRCFCEGRAEYLYWNGLIPHEEIERRLRLRRRFYDGPTEAEVAEVIDAGGVRWVVADDEHPAPTRVETDWVKMFERDGVRIYMRSELLERALRETASDVER